MPLHRLVTTRSLRRFVLGRAGLAFGLAAAAVGAALATGIMAYEAIVNHFDYTTLSWALIAPIWGLLAVLWILVRRGPMAAAVPAGWLAILAGLYFSDVYGQYPAGVLFVLAAAVVFLPDPDTPEEETSTTEQMHSRENGESPLQVYEAEG